jgi:hypothetical protein
MEGDGGQMIRVASWNDIESSVQASESSPIGNQAKQKALPYNK